MNLMSDLVTYSNMIKKYNKILLCGGLLASIFVLSTNLYAHENRTFEAVLKAEFTSCELQKENIFLTSGQKSKIENLINDELHSQILLRYQAKCSQKVGHIYIDSHIVRTLNETIVAHIENEKIKKYEIASFMEPNEFLAPEKWVHQFLGKSFDDAKTNIKVDGLSGATLTASALKKSVRKILVIDKVLKSHE